MSETIVRTTNEGKLLIIVDGYAICLSPEEWHRRVKETYDEEETTS